MSELVKPRVQIPPVSKYWQLNSLWPHNPVMFTHYRTCWNVQQYCLCVFYKACYSVRTSQTTNIVLCSHITVAISCHSKWNIPPTTLRKYPPTPTLVVKANVLKYQFITWSSTSSNVYQLNVSVSSPDSFQLDQLWWFILCKYDVIWFWFSFLLLFEWIYEFLLILLLPFATGSSVIVPIFFELSFPTTRLEFRWMRQI